MDVRLARAKEVAAAKAAARPAAEAACAAIAVDQHGALLRVVAKNASTCNATTNPAGPHKGHSPLHAAAEQGRVRMLLAMLDLGELVELGISSDSEARDLPLGATVAAGQARAATVLLDRGADANAARASDGFCALHIAVATESVELCVLLAGHDGIDMDVKAKNGDTVASYSGG